jgi:hypothetical protein
MKHPVRFDIFDEVQLIPPSDDVDYSVYDIDKGDHYIFDKTNEGDAKSHERYVAFVKKLEERGGVKAFLLATVRQIADMQTGDSSTRGASGIAGDEMVIQKGAAKTLRFANRWHRSVQFHAKLATIQAHYAYEKPWDWVLARFAAGHVYSDISHALGVELSTLTTWLWSSAPQDALAAAQRARTSHLLDQADKIAHEALSADFDVIQDGLAAEQKAKVLSALSAHTKLQAVAFHAAYQPKQSTVSVTPGAIAITLSLPD